MSVTPSGSKLADAALRAASDGYAWLFRNALYPIYETRLRDRLTLTELAELEHSQWKTEAELTELNWRRMQEALAHAEKHVPFYRKRFAEYGVSAARVQSPDDLVSFPIVTKKDLRQHGPDFVSEAFRGQLIQSGTGGSTGEPMRFAYDHETYERRIAAALRADGWAGGRLGDREWHLWGTQLTGMTTKKKARRAVYEAVFQRRMVDTFSLSDAKFDELITEFQRFRPALVIGYTTPLYLFARRVLERGVTLPPPRGVVATAERLFAHQRTTIEDAFGAKVFDRYGCREIMLIASECERHEGKHLNMENAFVELVNGGRLAKPGEPGRVLLSDLRSRSMPLLRYENQDVAVRESKRCSCGRGLPLLGSVEGRVLDMLRGPSGELLSGEFFPHLLKDFPQVAKYQVHQAASLAITVRLVPGRGFTGEVPRVVEELLRARLGRGAELRVDVVDDIPLTSGGKHRVTVSDVPVVIASPDQPPPREPSLAPVPSSADERSPESHAA